jgi:basic membrane protein A
MTHGNQAVSAVGGKRTQAVRDLIGGFAAGARRARPDIRVLVDYSGTFQPGASCAALARKQVERGSKVVFDVAGACGVGALQTAGLLGVWGIVVSQILASVVKRLDQATLLAVTELVSGQLPRGQDIPLDLASGDIGLVGISNSGVPRTVRLKVDALEATLLARDRARGAR